MTLLDAPVIAPSGVAPPAARPSPAVGPSPERRVTLAGVHWETYVRLSNEIGPGARITFDHGWMEIEMPSEPHELVATCLGRIVEAYADAAEIDTEGLGTWTMRREDLARGLEPDKCYYVRHAVYVLGLRGQRRLDLSIDPPPDLAIEVDISPPDLDKQPIYAALGVPEIWRHNGRAVAYLTRQPDGSYVVADHSSAFPSLPVQWVNDALAIALVDGQRAAAAEIRRRVTAAAPTAR